MTMSSYALIEAPFGVILVQCRAQTYSITLADKVERLNIQETAAHENQNVTLKNLSTQIQAYLKDKNVILNAIDSIQSPAYSQQGTAFQKRVWQAIKEIPLGETQTYSDIARKIGSGPRAVANACGANMLPMMIPCHRVVAKNGLGGFMQGNPQGLMIKKWLLQHEGVIF